MAIARKPGGKSAKPELIEGTVELPPPPAPAGDDLVIPALQESLEATLGKAEEMQEQIRRTAEQSVEQTKRLYEKMKTAAEEATSSVETSLSTISRGVSDLNLKALETMKANSDAQFEFFKSLMATKSLSDAIALQGEHARLQFEAMNAQAKEFAALFQQVSADSLAPLKASFTKNLQLAA